MTGHSVKIAHGYGDAIHITLDDKELKKVKGFVVHGKAGQSPELTVTLDITSVAYRQKKTEEGKEE